MGRATSLQANNSRDRSTSRPVVLHVTQSRGGGVPRAITDYVRNTPHLSHAILWDAENDNMALGLDAQIHRLPRPKIRQPKAILELLERIQPDVVHAHSSWAGLYARVLPIKLPVIYQPHCYKFEDEGMNPLVRWGVWNVERMLAPRATASALLSPREQHLAQCLHPEGRTIVIPNTSNFAAQRKAGTAFEAWPRVIMIGRISPQKDPDFFACVANRVHAMQPDVEFVWVGDGDPNLKSRLLDAGVKVTGWLTEDSLAELLSQPSVYFHSAKYEGFPLSLLDAATYEHLLVARTIPALDGLGIPGAEQPDDCADVILNVIGGQHQYLDEARSAAERLNTTMTNERQRALLSRLYATVGLESDA